MIPWMFATALAASVPGDADYVLPAVNADSWRTTWDNSEGFASDGARRIHGAVGGVELVWASRPLVWSDGDREVALVRDLFVAHIGGGAGVGPLVFGVDAPVTLVRTSDLTETQAFAAGNPALDAAWMVRDGGRHGWGVALRGRFLLPFGADDSQTGAAGFSGSVGASAEGTVGRLTLQGDVQSQWAKKVDVGPETVNDSVRFAGGGSVRTSDRLFVSLEAAGTYGGDKAANPVEGVGGFTYRLPATDVGLAAGVGIFDGIGSPAWRLILTVRQHSR